MVAVWYFARMTIQPPKRRQRKRERTASHLSATAFKLFEAHGYDAVSMEQIADEADVAKATLYNHFPVKEALLAHRFREDIAAGMTELATALAAHKSFDQRMRYLLRESAAWHSERRAYMPHYLRFLTSQASYGETPTNHALRDQRFDTDTRQILTLMIQAGQMAGEIDTRQTAEQIAWSFEYLLFGAVSAWLCDPNTDLTTRFLAAFDLLMHGISSAHPAKTTANTKAQTTTARSRSSGVK
ncbi:TetR family transcriptional regulator [Permianibacter aggregans]|uniref:TetR family transcriptional regulator n=2 Tax=Permianibacter aggregans TaxID=1510150 RepID=A0A4R6UMX6_9GAMM|nr:TetR family transcriptional regulator [Permianibacter aggregans]